ncbi:MAG: SLC13 family permease, partial [Saprospiraceae bacterium]
ACSIGGLGTVVGTPTNAIFISFVQQKMGTTVSFWQWFLFGLPFCATLLVACWLLLVRLFPLPKTLINSDNAHAMIKTELAALGKVTPPERRLFWLFGAVIAAWVTGSLIWYAWWPNCNDTVVMMSGAILLFIIPAGSVSGSGEPTALLDWPTALRIPWGIMLLFGGGLALAKGFDQSGLATWMGEAMRGLSTLPHVLIIFVVLAVVVLLSEVASNIATASMMMPVLAALAVSIGTHPFALLISATMAASFGFGLPVATAPNSIVYSSGYLRTRDMARAGFLLDLVAVLLLLGFLYGLLPLVWGIHV